jgi:thioredoxin 1
MSNYIAITTDKELQNTIKKGLTVVDYGAEWCSPCKKFKSTYKKFSEDNNDVTFIVIDVDKFDGDTPSSVPTFKFFNNGKQTMEFAGADKNKFEKCLNELKESKELK